MPQVIQETVTTQTPNMSVTNSTTKDSPTQTIVYLVYFSFGILEALLLARFLLRLTGANSGSGFVNFVYSLTHLFILPFLGIFPAATTQGAVTTAVFEPATLVALIVYAFVSWGVVRLIAIASRQTEEAA